MQFSVLGIEDPSWDGPSTVTELRGIGYGKVMVDGGDVVEACFLYLLLLRRHCVSDVLLYVESAIRLPRRPRLEI